MRRFFHHLKIYFSSRPSGCGHETFNLSFRSSHFPPRYMKALRTLDDVDGSRIGLSPVDIWRIYHYLPRFYPYLRWFFRRISYNHQHQCIFFYLFLFGENFHHFHNIHRPSETVPSRLHARPGAPWLAGSYSASPHWRCQPVPRSRGFSAGGLVRLACHGPSGIFQPPPKKKNIKTFSVSKKKKRQNAGEIWKRRSCWLASFFWSVHLKNAFFFQGQTCRWLQDSVRDPGPS